VSIGSFDGRVVAITGAGSGIGRALALEAAARGAHLALSDVDADRVDATAALLTDGARHVTTATLDVADRDAVVDWAEQVVADHGSVNVIVNNAGVALMAPVAELEIDDFRWLMDINFWGVVHGTQAFLPHLKASDRGHVVNISSVFGLMAIPSQAAYNASKFAVRGFTDALRIELEVEGAAVSATTIHPGGIKTNIARDGVGSGARREPTDVVALQRRRAAHRHRLDGFVDGHAHLPDRNRDAERVRRGVAGTRVAVGRDRDGRAGIDEPAGVQVRLLGGEVGGRQQRGHRVATGQCLDVVVAQMRAMVHRRAAALDGELYPATGAQLVPVQAKAEPGGAARLEHRPTLVDIERADFAEGVDPLRMRRRGGEHLATHEVDVVVGTTGKLARQQVRAEEGRLHRVRFGDPEGANLVDHVQSVARLDLDRGRAGPVRLVQSHSHEAIERLGRHGTSGVGGDSYPAAVVGLPGHAGGELLGPVAGEHQMRVGVDEAGEDGSALGVDSIIGHGSCRTDRKHTIIVEDDRRILDDSERTSAERRIVGDETADVVDHGGTTGGHSKSSSMLVASSCAVSIRTCRPSTTTGSPSITTE